MNRLLLFAPLVAATVMGCTHNELTSVDENPSELLAAASSAPSAYDVFLVQIAGADLYNPGVLTSKGVMFAFAQANTGGQMYLRWEDGVTTAVGQIPSRSFYMASSPSGMVGGAFGACPPGSACDEFRAFYLWRDGAVIQEIPIPPPGRNVNMRSLQDDGSFLATIDDKPYLYENGALQLLTGLGPPGSFYQAIGRNEKGQVFGTSQAPGYRFYRAVLWENGVPAALPDLESTPCTDDPQQVCAISFANAINKHGDVAGFVSNGETGEYRSVVWRYGLPPVHIDVLPGEFSMGSKINDRGQVVVTGFSRGRPAATNPSPLFPPTSHTTPPARRGALPAYVAAVYRSTATLKPPIAMRFQSNGMYFGSFIISFIFGSLITFLFTLSRCALDL